MGTTTTATPDTTTGKAMEGFSAAVIGFVLIGKLGQFAASVVLVADCAFLPSLRESGNLALTLTKFARHKTKLTCQTQNTCRVQGWASDVGQCLIMTTLTTIHSDKLKGSRNIGATLQLISEVFS